MNYRVSNKRLSLTKQQYVLLGRMFHILSAFGIKFQKLPYKRNLLGTLRKVADLITQMGFSQGQVIPPLKPMASNGSFRVPKECVLPS